VRVARLKLEVGAGLRLLRGVSSTTSSPWPH
jgi:hypothetical protein